MSTSTCCTPTTPNPGSTAAWSDAWPGCPSSSTPCTGSTPPTTTRWSKRLLVYALEAIAARFSDAELFQNPEDLELTRRWHITRRRRARLLGNGVDLTRFDPDRVAPSERAAVRAELGVGPDDVVVGTVGRLVAEKGYPELFEAARSLGPGVVLVVVGPDDPEKADRLPAELVEAAAADGVRFLGMRDDVDRLYAAFDVFVLPSHREGFPRAAMEAAAMGLPVVATDIRGCRQVVDDGVTGMLVPVADPVAFGACAAHGRRRCRPARPAWALPGGRRPGPSSTSATSCGRCSTPIATSPGGRASRSSPGEARSLRW